MFLLNIYLMVKKILIFLESTTINMFVLSDYRNWEEFVNWK